MRPTHIDAANAATTRLRSVEWQRIRKDVLDCGFATLPVLSSEECAQVRAFYSRENLFRKRICMGQHAYGEGEYKYFSYPLPGLVARLREFFYGELASAANEWAERLGKPDRYPAELADFIARCHECGQSRPTPLMLKYRAGDYNRLHQDLYGERYFPFQVAVLLNRPGSDFTGGEFVLVANRPRVQSKASVVPLEEGQAIIFAVNERPDRGPRGFRREALRHGVSSIHSGERYTLGLIFHDAR